MEPRDTYGILRRSPSTRDGQRAPRNLVMVKATKPRSSRYGPDPNNKRTAYYFRKAFTVQDPAAFAALTLRYLRDDGCVIYLNGTEIVRSNMPGGTVTPATLALLPLGSPEENTWLQAPVDPHLLVVGSNVIAVEVHQASANSDDLGFDLELQGTDAPLPAPTVTLAAPSHLGTVSGANTIFEASVTAQSGLASATLLIGGAPQTVSFSGPSQVQDTLINGDSPTLTAGTAQNFKIDGLTPHAHGLIKFPTLIGNGSGQVPLGSIVTSAILRFDCINPGDQVRMYRLTEDWVEDGATWNERAFGVPWGAPGADGLPSRANVSVAFDCLAPGQRTVDVASFVQDWANGVANYGIVMTDTGPDSVVLSSSETTATPLLTVTFKVGQTSLTTQSLSGTSALVTFPVSLLPGMYFWNVQVTDTTGRSSISPTDFQVIADPLAPNSPQIVLPADGATDVSTSAPLQTLVSAPAGGNLTVSAMVRRAAAPEFTIIVVPDTQVYSRFYPNIFTAQTQWIASNVATRNIVFVTHEGDIIHNYDVPAQWLNAKTSMRLLDGVVPYGIAPGNHDQPTANFNSYFPYTDYVGLPWYGGHFQNLNDYSFQLFSGGGMDFVIVHFEFCPSAAGISWADSVLKTYPNRIGIVTTHGFLDLSAQRYADRCGSTQYIWNGLAVPNPNLHFILSGHMHGESRRADVVNGHPVFQILANYQHRVNGGDGFLRIMRFVPADNKIYTQTYSPWFDGFETDADSQFTLDFPMSAAFAPAGTTSVASGVPRPLFQPACSRRQRTNGR